MTKYGNELTHFLMGTIFLDYYDVYGIHSHALTTAELVSNDCSHMFEQSFGLVRIHIFPLDMYSVHK